MARAMKDSGIAWIGEIPEEWEISRIKYVAEFEPRCDTESLDEDSVITYTPMEYIKNGYYIQHTAVYGLLAASLTPYQENDIVMAKVTPCFENGNIAVMKGLASGFGLGSSELFVFRPKSIHGQYLFYWLQNKAFMERAISTMTGTGGLKRVSPAFVRNCEIHIPPKSEQVRIANILDTECARIDAVIEQTRASIEEYKKMKQAIITQAVTKGIRPKRPMKDSGIEWIGDIPEDWLCTKFKYIATVKSNLVQPDEYGEYLQVSPENIEKGSGRLLPCRTVSEVGVISGNHLFFKGQILYSKIRPKLNKVTIATFDGLCSADMYPIETTLNTQYFVYALRSECFLAQVGLITEDRVKMPKINQDELSNTQFAVPPYNEQVEIAEYLDEKFMEIDGILEQKQKLLVDLNTYKKSMIYEYVTGKKEV